MADLSPHRMTLHVVPEPDVEPLVQRLVHRRFLDEHADPVAAHGAAVAMVGRILPRTRLMRVLDDADGRSDLREVGHVWLVQQGDDLSVLDLTLTDRAAAAGVRHLLVDLATDEGSTRLTVGMAPGDVVAEAFVVGGGFAVAATQMRLDLDHELPREDVVVLEPMDDDAYVAWEADEVETYAEERVRSGESPERARQVSLEQHADLLPDGLHTPHHQFFVGRVHGEAVGILWIGTERPMAFVYDVAVDEAHRRRGYGAGLMRAGALWAQQHGSHALGLNVFGHNHGAKALYDKLGYHVTEEFVGKRL